MPLKQFEFGDDQAARLEETAAELKQSQVQTVRDALRVYRRILSFARTGGKPVIVNDGKVITEIQGPWDDFRPVVGSVA